MDDMSETREKLANYAHEAWSGWMRYLFEKSRHNDDGTVTIPAWAVESWTRQAETSYRSLPEDKKKWDREEADRILAIRLDEQVEMARFTQWAVEQEMDIAAYTNPKFSEYDFEDIQTQMMWDCWKAAVNALPLEADICPICNADLTDLLGKEPWFVADEGGVSPGYDFGPNTHWVRGTQTCPECGATWPAGYSD